MTRSIVRSSCRRLCAMCQPQGHQPRDARVILGAAADARAEPMLPHCCDGQHPCDCDDTGDGWPDIDAPCGSYWLGGDPPHQPCHACEWCWLAEAPAPAPWLPTLAEVARVYDPERRAAEKQAVRDRDAEALRSGEATAADLRAENGMVRVRGRIREFR